MKILITCYYELVEALECAANSLRKLGYEVVGYPLYKYYNDLHDKDPNYVQNFIKYIQNNNIDIILWWYFSIPTAAMKTIVINNPKIKNIMFNWDEPYNWAACDIQNKAKLFDCVFVTSAEKLDDYIQYGSGKAVLQYPGYSEDLYNIIIEENESDKTKYECDISICCTNLYDNDNLYPNQYIKRKELVDKLYDGQKVYGYKFHIYGPDKFKNMYPESYKGYVKYYDTNKLFNYSKINICTHVQCNTYKYINERVVLILGSGGLLLVDKVDGIDEILVPNKECVILDKDNYMNQILNILNNYDNYYIIRHNGKEKSKLFTWDEWSKNISNHILRFF